MTKKPVLSEGKKVLRDVVGGDEGISDVVKQRRTVIKELDVMKGCSAPSTDNRISTFIGWPKI